MKAELQSTRKRDMPRLKSQRAEQQRVIKTDRQEKINKLHILLGIAEGEKEEILAFLLDKTADMICNYCRMSAVPAELENIQLNMVVDMYRAESLGQENAQGIVKSISEGDVSVSFGSASAVSENPGMEFLKSYEAQLNRFRKAGW